MIDADNAPAKSIQVILSELARYGKVNIRRAYGNWTMQNLKGWEAILQDHAIQPIQQYALTKGKNATDIAIAIDVMDILYTKQVDIFSIVTSDCDFTPLVTRILSEGRMVIGFGERKTPSPLVNACSNFLFLDEESTSLDSSPKQNDTTRKNGSSLKCDTKLMNLVRDAIKGTENEEGWAKLSRVGSHISNHASFDSRNYGYERLSDLILAIDLFEIKRDQNQHFIVRDKRKHNIPINADP
jgi:uncharacterized protein (TIGR00288 family)